MARRESNTGRSKTARPKAAAKRVSRNASKELPHSQRLSEWIDLAQRAASFVLFDWNPQTDTIVWSGDVAAVFGLPAGDWEGAHATWSRRIVHPEDIPRLSTAIEKSFSAHLSYEFDYRVTWPDGSIHWVQSRGTPTHYNEAGKPTRVMGMAQLVDARKHREEELRKRTEELEKLMDLVPAALWVAHDPYCHDITGNATANQLYEAERGENVSASPEPGVSIRPRRFFKDGRALKPEELPMQLAAAKGIEIRGAELEVALPSGRQVTMLGSASPLLDTKGDVRGCVGVFLDITDYRRAEDELRKNETRFRSMFEHHKAVMLLIEPTTGEIVEANQAATAFYGFTRDEIRKLRIQEINALPPEEVFAERQRAVADKRNHFVFPHRMSNGQIRWVEVYSSPVEVSGRPLLFSVIHDITDRRRAEEELANAAQFPEENPNPVLRVAQDGKVLYCNGRARALLIGEGWGEEGLAPAQIRTMAETALQSKRAREADVPCSNGKTMSFICVPMPSKGYANFYGREVTEERHAQRERELTVDFLRIANITKGTRELVESAVHFFRAESGCESVAIRLRSGDDFPYHSVCGFSDSFVATENTLWARGAQANHCAGSPFLECMCGNVVSGRYDPTRPFFTRSGSFWTGSMSEFMATTTEEERLAPTRNRCGGEGYESIALIPLVAGNERFGLVQLNSRRKGVFTAIQIALWERLVNYLAASIAKCQSEEALRASEERFRLLVEQASDGIFVSDSEGHYTDVNSAGHQMLGYTREEFLRLSIPDVIAQEDVPRLPGEIARFDGGKIVRSEWCFLRKDGSTFDGEINGRRLPDGRLQAILRDITERKRAEAALIRSEKLASTGRLAATIAHEVNNPLAAAVNAIFIAGLDRTLSSETRQYLLTADEELRRATEITRQTLGFYRETGRSEPVQMSAVAEAVLDLYTKRIRYKGIVVKRKYRTTPLAFAVAGEMRQVVANLVANAADATSAGGTLMVRTSRVGSRVAVTIADTGTGMDAAHLKRVFEPFFTTKETVGTGLGLWVSREIVRKHGGQIRVRSKVGKGTVFAVYIPVAPAQAAIGT